MSHSPTGREYTAARRPLTVTMFTLAGRCLGLLGLGALVGLSINAIRPDGVRLGADVSSHGAVLCAPSATQPGPPGRTVDVLMPDQAAGLCGDPRTLVADTRSAEEFAQGHVTGAIHLPCASSRGTATAALDLLADKQALIVYGNGTDDAIPVAEEMHRRSGHPHLRVAVLAGGFAAWSQAGLACSSGPCNDCQAPGHP